MGALCYGALLALLARWRARLPAKASVYIYFSVLLLLDLFAALGAPSPPHELRDFASVLPKAVRTPDSQMRSC